MKTKRTTGSRRACDRDGKASTRTSVWKIVGGAVLLAAGKVDGGALWAALAA